jgi:hypothetical protein
LPATFFLVRSVVAAPLRAKFDHWYATDHLPRAHADFRSEKCWRFWSAAEEGVHYAVYQFPDKAACDAALASPAFKELVADYDRSFPQGVTRTRDVVTLVQKLGGV